ncbi:MAG: hypothetical protein KDA44_09895, partial [Planctomycetales bacterium]|nr:hypothetical protein [Planctomycetales bacterium]
MMPLAQRLVISVITLAAVFAADACGEAVRVDLSLASGRKDTETPGWQEWEVAHGASVSTVIDGVEIELAAPGGELKGDWYKAGLATGATLATDGVTATIDDAQLPPESKDRGLVITLRGLAPGAHTLTTYHNSFGTEPLAPCSVHAGGTSSASSASVTPSVRAADNDGAATAYVEFDVSEGDEAVIAVTTEGDRVVLNGFAIDAPNPRCQARRPQPANRDWHADADDGTVRLAWEPADDAAKQRAFVVVADDAASGAAQLGELTADDATAALNGDASSLDYQFAAPVGELSRSYVCWRVDTIDADGRVTPGNVWTFRPRHLAFPGAEGYGRFAIGGRGGQVLHVTNLNDSGPGSLRAAVEAEGPRTVVFDVSGRIVLKDRLIIRNPYLTIAGQTAPGKGVCISNYNLGMLGAHDCIVRYIRVRPGDTAGKTLDGMGMAGADHAIIDHCSISWT